MSFIDPDELAAARDDADELLPTTCTILDAVETSDGGGGTTVTYEPRAETVPCRIAPLLRLEGETVRGDRVSDRSTHWITLPAGTVVGDADRVRIDTTDYEITLVHERSVELIRRLLVREVE